MALGDGDTFVDLSHWRKVAVTGGDALEWLDSLVSADIARLSPGWARRSLLLSPTGQVRADFTVAARADQILLIQDPEQPHAVDELLARYVLSSDVALEDRTLDLALFAFPGLDDPPGVSGAELSRPSCLGPGLDLIAPADRHASLIDHLKKQYQLAGNEELEAWRIAAAMPRVGVDVLDEDLPQEAGLEEAVSYDKGCFLGQEAMAKVRNLGHPRRVLVRIESNERLSPGDSVFVGEDQVGSITSAASDQGGTVALAKVRWGARRGPFTVRDGVRARVRT